MENVQQSESGDAGPKRGSVLLVDDEPALLEIFSEVLSPAFDVQVAMSPKAAMMLLDERRFNVVVADYLMPGASGVDFLRRCGVEFPAMRRVLLSGMPEDELRRRGLESAALFAFLMKPVNLSELVSTVTAAVESCSV